MEGNTLGKIVGQASASTLSASEANPPVTPETNEEKGFWRSVGGWFVEQGDNIAEAVQHPWEATKGTAKGLWNMVPDIGTLMAQGSVYQAAADMEQSAAMMSLFGMGEQAKVQSEVAQHMRTNVSDVNFNDYRLNMSNKAQEGGDLIATVGSLFVPAGWLGKLSKVGKVDKVAKTTKAIDEAVDTAKVVDKALDGAKFGEQAAKEVAEETAEKTAKEAGAKVGPKLAPLEDGPYIKNGKPNGRPGPTGEEKLTFEKKVYDEQVSPDGVLRDQNPPYEVIDWKPGDARKGVADFGHTPGNSYQKVFERYKNREISLDELKEFQSNPDNFRIEIPSKNRSHMHE